MEALKAFDSTIKRARALIRAHTKLHGQGRGKRPRFHSELLRAALVTSVSAMDAYFHDKIAQNIARTIKRTEPDFPVELVSLLSEVGKNKEDVVRALLKVTTRDRPLAHVSTQVNRLLSERTYQDPGKIEQGLKTIGINGFWQSVAPKLNTTPDQLKRDVVRYIKRRHAIVHVGDLGTSKKTRHRVRKISPSFSLECVDFIERFVYAANDVVNQQI